jgi:hypothetical protein
MSDSHTLESSRDIQLENFAANLADAAYRVALQHGVGDRWLELEVDLWGAMTEAIEQRSCIHPHEGRFDRRVCK